MKVIEKKINDIIPYDNNPRNNDHAVDAVANSIKEFGFKVPIVIDADDVIVAGHTRIKAAKKLNMDTVPCVVADDLSPEQVKAFRLADNKTAELAEWNLPELNIELSEIEDIDMSEFGFDLENIELSSDEDPEEDEYEESDEIESVVKKGEVWALGKHRLMCGDATSEDDVTNLMDGQHADICFTSPPYNMNQQTGFETAPKIAMGAGKAYKNYSDSLTDDEYEALICGALQNGLKFCDDVMLNIGILAGSKIGIASMIGNYKENLSDILVWNKDHAMPSGLPSHRGIVTHKAELIFCFNHKGSRAFSHPQWDIGTMTNVIETENDSGNKFSSEHHAAFPVSFPFKVIQNFTENSVLDLFGGTGTTMIAAEQLNRKCYMMELDPHYCDVIIDRWEEFTGEKAELIDGNEKK